MKKKLGTVASLSLAVIILASCGKSPQDEFIGYMESQNKQTVGTWDFNMAIEEIEVTDSPEAKTNPMINMMVTQIKDASIDGTVKADLEKEKAFGIDMKVKALGMEMPINMVGSFGKEPKMYLATDIYEYIMNIVGSMSQGAVDTSQLDMSKLKGKYLDLLDIDADTASKKELQDASKQFQQSEKNRQEMTKKYTEFLTGLDKKTFTKKEDVVTHTFTKEELTQMIKITADSTKDKSADLDKAFDEIKDISVKTSVDIKKDKTTMAIKMVPKDTEAGIKSLKMKMSTTMKDKKADIKLPKKEDIISSKELEKLFPQGAPAGQKEEISDADFQEATKALKEHKDQIDDKTKEELLANYKTVLSEEQYKEIESILK